MVRKSGGESSSRKIGLCRHFLQAMCQLCSALSLSYAEDACFAASSVASRIRALTLQHPDSALVLRSGAAARQPKPVPQRFPVNGEMQQGFQAKV